MRLSVVLFCYVDGLLKPASHACKLVKLALCRLARAGSEQALIIGKMLLQHDSGQDVPIVVAA